MTWGHTSYLLRDEGSVVGIVGEEPSIQATSHAEMNLGGKRNAHAM